jgi:hypothetical protein
MDLARNLKKILLSLANKISVETSYPYTEQKEKQTTKKQDNSLSTTSSQNPLTPEDQDGTIQMYCPDISEKTTMNATTEDIVSHIREWSIERVADKSISKEDARAVLEEFYEWIEPEDKEIEIISLEPES